ncbi:Sec-independent protein translocase subunit TatA [Nocardiopsis xinjiangensis]|uniref:Sec-independent protein translocase subunit TatA n=1 Tax=Nocardiopsis xinjiangensis TaxID=124285 RepID=UPI00034BE28E|nr:Sec-independent protein translocase subunit TatA [Nocardiopsis xinjiangensis]
MGPFNGPTIAILVIVALLLFGAKKLPDLARSLGRSARILKAESKGLVEEENEGKAEETEGQEQAETQQKPQPQQAQTQDQDDEPVQRDPRQLPPGQRIVNESGESAHHSYGN